MNWLNHIPLFRLLLPFSMGIMWAFYQPVPINLIILVVIVILALINILLIRLKVVHSSYHNRWVYGLFSSVFFFVVGITLANSRIEIFQDTHFSHYQTSNPSAYEGIISSEPEYKTNSIKAIIEIQKIKISGNWTSVTGKSLVYFKQNQGTVLNYGDKINFLKTPIEISPPSNFDEFDYKRYLAHHYIYHRLYLAEADFKITGYSSISWVQSKAIQWRNFLVNRYTQFGIKGEELAIISALTLGKKESLSNQLKSAYSSAGAMHVLAVSGLHVGIIIMVLQWLLKWMDRFTYGKTIRAVLLIISIWIYAFITGLSPSVIRAATMFTFMIIATSIKRKSNIYNTLALSAFVILLFRPFMILEVGFQLSYLAVIGIIYLHPYLYNLIKLKPGIIEKAWNITCVSLSAQLATAPLGILYFHQFPSYFLFSNLIVIPAAFGVVTLAIFFHIGSFIPYLGKILAFFLNGLVWVLNVLVKQIEGLPSSLINGLDISVIETWLMYAVIIGITVWLTQYKRIFLLIALLAVAGFTVTQTIEKWSQQHQKEITIYATGKSSSIEFTYGNSAEFITDSTTFNSLDKMQFYVYHHWWKRGLNSQNVRFFTPTVDEFIHAKNSALTIGNTRILKIENNCLFGPYQLKVFEPHILYVNTYKTLDFSSLITLQNKPIIVLGKGASKKVALQVKSFISKHNLPFSELGTDGSIKILLSETLEPLNIYTPKTSLKE